MSGERRAEGGGADCVWRKRRVGEGGKKGRRRLVFGEKLKTKSGAYQVVAERCLEEAGGTRRVCVSREGPGVKRRERWTGKTARVRVVVTTWEGSGQGSGDQLTRWLRNWKAGGGSQVRLRGETRPHRNE